MATLEWLRHTTWGGMYGAVLRSNGTIQLTKRTTALNLTVADIPSLRAALTELEQVWVRHLATCGETEARDG